MKKTIRILGMLIVCLVQINQTKSQNIIQGNYAKVVGTFYDNGKRIIAGKSGTKHFVTEINVTNADTLHMYLSSTFANGPVAIKIAPYVPHQALYLGDYGNVPCLFKTDLEGHIIKGTSWAGTPDVKPTGLNVGDHGITISADHYGQIWFHEIDTAGNTLMCVVILVYPGRLLDFVKDGEDYISLIFDTVLNMTRLIRSDTSGLVIDTTSIAAFEPNTGKIIKSGNKLAVMIADTAKYYLGTYDITSFNTINSLVMSPNNGGINDLYLDASTGNYLLTGWHMGMNISEVFVDIHSSTAQPLWSNIYNLGQSAEGSSGIIDSAGRIYLAGTTWAQQLFTMVAADPLGIEQQASSVEAKSQNFFHNEIKINGKRGEDCCIVNSLGKIVWHSKLVSETEIVRIAWPTGMYFINTGNNKSKKVMLLKD